MKIKNKILLSVEESDIKNGKLIIPEGIVEIADNVLKSDN